MSHDKDTPDVFPSSLVDRSKELMIQRDELIAAGMDPEKLDVPLTLIAATDLQALEDAGRLAITRDAKYQRDLFRAWIIVTAACIGAMAGLMTAVGIMLTVSGALTWHSTVTGGAALGWTVIAIYAGRHAYLLRLIARSRERLARDLEEPTGD